MPEETQTEESIESTQVVQTFPREWSIDQEIRGLSAKRHQSELRSFRLRRLESGKLVQHSEAVVAYVPAGFEATEFTVSRQRGDRAVACVTAQQIDFLQLIAEP